MIDWKTLTITACGIAIGWVFSQLSSWWNNRGQRQRTKRRMLFYLLELEYLIARMDLQREVDYMISSIRAKAGEAFTPEEEQKVRAQVRPMLVRMAVEWTLPELDELEKGYHGAVEELSYVAPFVAYRLKGRTGLLKRLELARGLIAKVPTLDPAVTAEHQQAFADFFEDLNPKATIEDLKAIRSELVSLSWRIGPVAVWKAKRRVRRSSSLTADDTKDMEEYLEQLIEFMTQRFPNG
ncbi:MAG: hypothetical protein JNM62_08615 [Flavobacteriales bacterium]|nr:hypothetical protein [Flavobacteriales bacterium]